MDFLSSSRLFFRPAGRKNNLLKKKSTMLPQARSIIGQGQPTQQLILDYLEHPCYYSHIRSRLCAPSRKQSRSWECTVGPSGTNQWKQIRGGRPMGKDLNKVMLTGH